MKRVAFFALAVTLFVSATAQASILTFTFGTEFSGSGGTLSGPVVVTIDDQNTPGSVVVTVDATGLDGSLTEYVSGLYLNFNPLKSLPVLGSALGGNPDLDAVNISTNAYKADGDGFFDIFAEWSNTSFTAGETDSFTLTGSGIVASDFFFGSAPSTGGSGPFYAALRARSLGDDGEDSGWFAPRGEIPEPGTLAIFAIGFACMAGGVARRRRS